MKKLYVFIFLFASIKCFGQIDTSMFSIGDTAVSRFYLKNYPDSGLVNKFVLSKTTSKYGVGIEIGLSYYAYNKKYNTWIPNHGGPNFGLYFIYHQLIIGGRFKPWTLETKSNLVLDSDTIASESLINLTKSELYIAYQLLKRNKFQIQLYVGSISELYYFHDDEIEDNSELPKLKSLMGGFNFSKNFYQKNGYFSLFLNTSYQGSPYNKINPEFGKGHLQFTFGVSATFKPKKIYWRLIE